MSFISFRCLAFLHTEFFSFLPALALCCHLQKALMPPVWWHPHGVAGHTSTVNLVRNRNGRTMAPCRRPAVGDRTYFRLLQTIQRACTFMIFCRLCFCVCQSSPASHLCLLWPSSDPSSLQRHQTAWQVKRKQQINRYQDVYRKHQFSLSCFLVKSCSQLGRRFLIYPRI